MPPTTNVVHQERQLRETIVNEETRAKRWEQTHGAKLGSAAGYQIRRVWDPQSLSQELKPWQTRGRSEFSRRHAPTSIVPGSQFEWANPHFAETSLCRSELMQHRRKELASATDAERTGGVSLRLDRPAFGPNERYNTFNSAGVIGQAAPFALPERPRYGRTTWVLSSSVDCRNDATQLMFGARTVGGMERATAARLFS